jgi:hypothetical protein
MSSALRDLDGGWLDTNCWGCGIGQGLCFSDGRLLCPSCRLDLSETPPDPSADPLRVGRGAYWEAHAMEWCWRCLAESVDPEDDVGLCRACRADLSGSKLASGPVTT